jgi:Putative  PD-(D/E)XK family member, (DUF4420)
MKEFDWSAGAITDLFEWIPERLQSSDITVLKFDSELQVVIGVTLDGKAFLAFRQFADVKGFKTTRAELKTMQSLNLGEFGVIEPAVTLDFIFQSQDEIKAIATIFSGLYQYNLDFPGTANATNAAQGFEDLISQISKIELTREIEVGLFGELSYIYASRNPELTLQSWHSIPNATYDFSHSGSHLEVKTSTRPTRRHWLRSTQSLVASSIGLYYLSIYASEDATGISVNDLVNRLASKLEPKSQMLLKEQLDPFNIEMAKLKFDLESTVASFKFIEGEYVPIPITTDKNILEIRWRCDFLALPDFEGACPWN